MSDDDERVVVPRLGINRTVADELRHIDEVELHERRRIRRQAEGLESDALFTYKQRLAEIESEEIEGYAHVGKNMDDRRQYQRARAVREDMLKPQPEPFVMADTARVTVE